MGPDGPCACREVLTADGSSTSAPVTNIGGAGGTVGLASLANETDPHTLMVMGLVMVGAVETNAAADPDRRHHPDRAAHRRTARRRRSGRLALRHPRRPRRGHRRERPGRHRHRRFSRRRRPHPRRACCSRRPASTSAEITEKLNYIPNSGGGEAVSLLLGNNASAGISGVGRVRRVRRSRTRSARSRSRASEPAALLPDVPTITDEGYDVVLTNWRGVLAPGDISDADGHGARRPRDRTCTSGEAWQTMLEEPRLDGCLPRPATSSRAFLDEQHRRGHRRPSRTSDWSQ